MHGHSYPDNRSYVVVFVSVWCVFVDCFREQEHDLDDWTEGVVWSGMKPESTGMMLDIQEKGDMG